MDVSRSTSYAENGALSETDLQGFRNEDQEIRDCGIDSEDGKVNEFPKSKALVTEFKDTLQIPHGKMTKSLCSFLYATQSVT